MRNPSDALPRAIAAVRVATSVFFLFFGEYKVAGPEFAHGGFQKYLQGYIDSSGVSFYSPFLAHVVLPHAVFFGYFVGALELFIGLSLLLGLWVKPASVLGALYMVNLTLATWWDPGHGVPFWRYFGNELDHLPLLLLFVISFSLTREECGDSMAAGGPEIVAERPAGVTAIAVIFFAAAAYLCAIAVIMLAWPGEVPMAAGAVLLHGLETAGPYMFLLTGAIATLIAWGLLRLNSFARWFAMLACMAGFVMLVPVVSAAAMDFGWPLLKSASQLIVRMVMVWYLSQTPVSERFGRGAVRPHRPT